MHCSVVVLVHLYLCLQNDSGRGLKWGDEVEYIIVKLDHEQKKARVSLRAATLLDLLTRPEEDMSENIRKRRGEKVTMNIPIFKDVNTLSPFREDLAAYGDDCSSAAAAKDDHIYLDAMGFGMGLCCLQLTFQVRPHRHYSGDT